MTDKISNSEGVCYLACGLSWSLLCLSIVGLGTPFSSAQYSAVLYALLFHHYEVPPSTTPTAPTEFGSTVLI